METPEAIAKFREFIQTHLDTPKADARTILNLSDIRRFSKELVSEVTDNPLGCIPHMEEELRELQVRRVGFSGALGRSSVTPRTVSSSLLNRLVSVEGIVTSTSLVRPKLHRSVHYCPAKNCFFYKDYRDATMITRLAPTNTIYPQKDLEGNPLSPEFGLSHYSDFQSVTLQEMPENSPPGSLPRSLECILSEDLVDSVKPGDRLRIYGVYKSIVHGTQFPSHFRTVLIANNVEPIRQSVTVAPRPRELLEQQDIHSSIFAMLSSSPLRFSSIAPSIFGHSSIKKALALMLVGGNEVVMSNGSRIRGDINIMLLGDPSTAKSQMLRYVLNFMPLTVATTGRGSSGVGLTAAVVVDKETGDRRLEAGAMVLADRGICCIDEFDKMNEHDRVAIHEVMEQQTVTIAKAGIHTTLNARCSVLAAANPVFGSYNSKLSVQENVRLPESLMTRFDLIFITVDTASVEEDSKISQHVLNMHINDGHSDDEVNQEIFKEYILRAKALRPVLTQEAAAYITAEYAQIRQLKNQKSLVVNVTPRLLETLIRLGTAHAKLRLSELVEVEDAQEAVSMVKENIQRKTVRTAGEKKRVRAEPTSLGAELRSISKDEILESIWKWKESHPESAYCDISELSGAPREDVIAVVEELAAQDIVVYDNEKIYFFD